jgi:DNA-directed RNA polymerase sigma subunit (sigma70/sigma32)
MTRNEKRQYQLLMLDILDLTFKRPHPYWLIALFMDVSWQRVHQIEQRALRKLRIAHRKSIARDTK